MFLLGRGTPRLHCLERIRQHRSGPRHRRRKLGSRYRLSSNSLVVQNVTQSSDTAIACVQCFVASRVLAAILAAGSVAGDNLEGTGSSIAREAARHPPRASRSRLEFARQLATVYRGGDSSSFWKAAASSRVFRRLSVVAFHLRCDDHDTRDSPCGHDPSCNAPRAFRQRTRQSSD